MSAFILYHAAGYWILSTAGTATCAVITALALGRRQAAPAVPAAAVPAALWQPDPYQVGQVIAVPTTPPVTGWDAFGAEVTSSAFVRWLAWLFGSWFAYLFIAAVLFVVALGTAA